MLLDCREKVFTANWKEAPACPRKLAVEVTFSDQINFQIIGFVLVFQLYTSLLMKSSRNYGHNDDTDLSSSWFDLEPIRTIAGSVDKGVAQLAVHPCVTVPSLSSPDLHDANL